MTESLAEFRFCGLTSKGGVDVLIFRFHKANQNPTEAAKVPERKAPPQLKCTEPLSPLEHQSSSQLHHRGFPADPPHMRWALAESAAKQRSEDEDYDEIRHGKAERWWLPRAP